MTIGRPFLHLTSGVVAGNVVREALLRLRRDEEVLAMRDNFADGPLHDADDGGAARVEWWTRLRGAPLDARRELEFDDADLWAHITASPTDVVIWHGPHPAERVFALRACFRLRTSPDRVHEVAYPTPPARRLESFFDSVAIRGADAAVSAWEHRQPVNDVASRARRWVELRDRPGDCLRLLDGEAIVEVPVTFYDAEIAQACGGRDWTNSSHVVGNVLARHPTNDRLLCWRVRELLRIGALRGRGAVSKLDLPSEIRWVE